MLKEDVVVFSERAAPLIIPRHRVVDIDTPEDWRLAELLYQALRSFPSRHSLESGNPEKQAAAKPHNKRENCHPR